MVGDVILYIKKLIKQLMCKHEFKYDGFNNGTDGIFKCTKCGKIRIVK